MIHLSPQKKKIFDFIRDYFAQHHEPPTIKEIRTEFNYRSPATVHTVLVDLEQGGWITREPHISRGIRIVQRNPGIGWLDR